MKSMHYECYETGIITEIEAAYPAQFITAKKYDILYAEELPRFKKDPVNVYALPHSDHPLRIYNGTDRMGFDITDPYKKDLTESERMLTPRLTNDFHYADELMQTEATALQYISLSENADAYELIWVRNSGLQNQIPAGYTFIGYDVSYPCDYSGSFSIICDCMFICRWHGCDEDGTVFASDFQKLNYYGLFDHWQDAYDYMVKYLNEGWTERGVYCILEIYKKL